MRKSNRTTKIKNESGGSADPLSMTVPKPNPQKISKEPISAAGIFTLVLDSQLRLLSVFPGPASPFPSDLDSPMDYIKSNLSYSDLEKDAVQVLKTLLPIERQLRYADGRWFLARLSPSSTEPFPNLALTLVDITNLSNSYITERRQIEERLGELSRRLTYHVDNSPLAVIEWGPDMRLIRWSGAAEAMFGWKASEVLGKRMEDFRWVYHEDVTHVEDVSTDLKTGANPQRYSENRNYRKDGSVIHCQWYNSSLVDDTGQLRSILSLVLDVTARKQAEADLRESRRKYQDLIETTGDFIWETDAQGRYTYCSPQMKELWGLEPSQMIGMTPFEVMPVEDRESAIEHVMRMSAIAAPFKGLTTRAFNSKGEMIYIETSGVPYFDSAGKLLGYRGITRDITDRRHFEQQLELSNQKLNEILDSIRDDFYVIDHDWNFAYANELFTSRFGLKPEDIVGQNIWELFSRHLGTALETNFRYTMEKREVRRFELSGRYTDAWYRVTVFPSAEGITVIGTDITEQKRVEAALRDNQQELALLNETLENRVQQQTAELRSLASDLTRAEHQERHRISHILHDDLQQRLYALQMQMEFLRQGYTIEDAGLRDDLAAVSSGLSEILSVTRHLSIDLSPPVLPDEGLTQAIRWLAAQMREQHGLQVEIQASGPFALHDESMQVLLFTCVRELLFNVVKHAGTDQARVILQWVKEGLQIEVCDDGRGFPANTVNASRVDPATTAGLAEGGFVPLMSNEEGRTSFGLPTIRHRLSLFGGSVRVSSTLGAGSQVVLTIPIEEKRVDK